MIISNTLAKFLAESRQFVLKSLQDSHWEFYRPEGQLCMSIGKRDLPRLEKTFPPDILEWFTNRARFVQVFIDNSNPRTPFVHWVSAQKTLVYSTNVRM
jgi:hypothetical protein